MRRFLSLVAIGSFIATTSPAFAAFHLARINEIMTSYGGDPNAEFVEIRMLAGGQTVVNGSILATFDSGGNYIGDVLTVGANLSNGGTDVRWLMGSAAYAGLGGAVAPDFVFPNGSLPDAGGMICWGKPPPGQHVDPNKYVDCLAYGTYAGLGNSNLCAPSWSDADGHSVVRTGDGINQLIDTTCSDPATPQNNGGMVGSLAATTACGAPPAANRDLVLVPPKPLNVTIPSPAGTVVKTVKVKVTNADLFCGGIDDTATIMAAPMACPGGMTITGPDFDNATPGDQTTVIVAPGKTKTAKFSITFNNADFAMVNKKTLPRCTVNFTADSATGLETRPPNNVAPMEINVTDKLDTDMATTGEHTIKSLNPVKVTIPDFAVAKTKNITAVVGNADIVPSPDPLGHTITVSPSDGTCAAGATSAIDFDPAVAGSQMSAVVKGGKTKSGKFVLNIHPLHYTTTNIKSPHRCLVSVPISEADGVGSNNTTQMVVDVIDKNDF